jgi:hypothetical protein
VGEDVSIARLCAQIMTAAYVESISTIDRLTMLMGAM